MYGGALEAVVVRDGEASGVFLVGTLMVPKT